MGKKTRVSGTIDISQLVTPPDKHEFETARFFADMGKDITFIRPSAIPNQKRPDILMDGIEWEIKCPEGKSSRTIERHIYAAEQQSHYIIINLRWIQLPEKQCLSEIRRNFETKKKIKRILVITKNMDLVEFPLQFTG